MKSGAKPSTKVSLTLARITQQTNKGESNAPRFYSSNSPSGRSSINDISIVKHSPKK